MHSSKPDRSAAEHTPQNKNSKPEAADAKAAATAHRNGKHSTRPPLSRKTLLLRKLRRFVWWLLLLPLLAAAALWYWSHSAQSLRQALELAQQQVPGLHFDGVSGSLWGGGQIRSLHWSDGNTRVHANDVSVHWDVMQLQKNRTLAISRLHAESLTIRSRADDSQAESQPIALPEALTLPLSVAAEDLNIQQLLVYIDDIDDIDGIDDAAQPEAAQQQTPEQAEQKPPAVALTDIRGSYHYNASQQQHNASISHAATRQDAVIVRAAVPQLTLSATAPFALTARLEADAAMYSSDTAAMSASAGKGTAPEPAAEIALELGITASGELENPQLRIDAREIQAQNATQPPFTLQGTASLLPLTPAALQRAELQLLHFNPARFDDSAPRASLDTRLTVQPVLDSDKPELVQAWQVQLASHNRHSGTFEKQLLPLEQLRATLHWQPQQPARLTADNINIQWPQGSTTGKAHLDWSNADALQWGGALQLHDINPQLLAADAPPANISGTLHFHPPEPQQHDSLLHVQLELHNSTAGSWDSNRLPLSRINTLLTLHSQSLTLQNIQAQTGGGSVSGNFSTRISTPYTWQGKLAVNGINPHELHSAAAPARLQGELRVGNADDLHSAGITDRQHSNATADDDTVHFAVNLTGKLLEPPRQQQVSAGNSNLSALPGLPFDKLVLSGSVGTGTQQNVALHHIDIAAMNAIVTGKAGINPQTLAFNTDGLRIQTPGLDARLNGGISPSDGKGSLAIRLDNASSFQSWLDSIFRAQTPAWIQPLQQGKLSGSASLEADWTGGWENPTLQAKLNSPHLSMLPTAAAEQAAEAPEKAKTAKTAKQKPTSAAPIWQTEKTHVQIQGTLQDANISGSSNIQLGSSNATLKLKANAGHNSENGRTRATIDTLSATMKTAAAASQASKARTGSTTSAGNIPPPQWQARLTRTVQLQWQDKQLHIGSGSATVSTAGTGTGSKAVRPATASVHWQDSHWSQAAESAWGNIRTSGRLTGLPLRWVELVRPGTLNLAGVDTSLLFDGKWDIHTDPELRFSAQLQRSSGDVHMLFADQLAAEISGETHSHSQAPATAGVKTAQLRIHNQGTRFHLNADWNSANAGNMQLHLQSSLQQTADGWSWEEKTPVSGTLKMQLPQVGIWSSLAPVGWRISGGISAQADISGNRNQPQIQGRFSSENIRIYSLTDGLELENGSLKGRFDSSHLSLDTLTFSSEGGGTLTGSGKAEWADTQQQKKDFRVGFRAKADRLQISNRPDRRLSFSGTLRANGNTEKITIKGNAAIDQAQIILADEAAPALSDDVTVIYPEESENQPGSAAPPGSAGARSRAQQKAERKQQKKAQQQARKAGQQQSIHLQAAIDLDLGNSFRLQGMGLDTFLSGKLSITSDGDAPRVHGTISTRMGEFRAYGQWLEIEKGKIRFSGKYDNPSLDITALRPRTEVDVGVQVSGPAFNPKIRLISTPDMPDTEKLSWLILGREGAEGGAESALLQQAAIALIGGGGTGKSVAQRVGLDEIGINRENGETSSVSFGKRLSRKLYLSYETSLLDSVSTLYLFYDISRRFKIRAQTGNEQAVDLIFTLRYDDLPDAMRQLRGKPADNPRAATPTAAKPQ